MVALVVTDKLGTLTLVALSVLHPIVVVTSNTLHPISLSQNIVPVANTSWIVAKLLISTSPLKMALPELVCLLTFSWLPTVVLVVDKVVIVPSVLILVFPN